MKKRIFLGLNLLLLTALIFTFSFGVNGVSAQTVLTKGGAGFDSAIELKPGAYSGGPIAVDESQYYFFTASQGKMIKVDATFTAAESYGSNNELVIYDTDKQEIVKDSEISGTAMSLTALPNSEKDTYKYYLKIDDLTFGVSSFSLALSMSDKFDANTQKDAGDNFDKASSVNLGDIKGYLAGGMGSDTKDFYKLTLKKGAPFTAKVTPEGDATLSLTVYDKDRQQLGLEYGTNGGASVTVSPNITKEGDVYIEVACDINCSSNITPYTLKLTWEKSETQAAEESANAAATNTAKKIGWTVLAVIIGGALLFIIIIVLIIVWIVRRGKNNQNTPPAQTK